MKTLVFALFAATAAVTAVHPAAAADLPRGSIAPPAVYAPRIYVPTYCRIRTERFFDGYAWRSRDVQVCH